MEVGRGSMRVGAMSEVVGRAMLTVEPCVVVGSGKHKAQGRHANAGARCTERGDRFHALADAMRPSTRHTTRGRRRRRSTIGRTAQRVSRPRRLHSGVGSSLY